MFGTAKSVLARLGAGQGSTLEVTSWEGDVTKISIAGAIDGILGLELPFHNVDHL